MSIGKTYPAAGEPAAALAPVIQMPARHKADPVCDRLREDVLPALLLDLPSEKSRVLYADAIGHFLGWLGASGRAFDEDAVSVYREHLLTRGTGRGRCDALSPVTVNLWLSAIRQLAGKAATRGVIDRESATSVREAKSAKRTGTRLGNWLTLDQVERLLERPDTRTLKGKRDYALLAVLVGSAVRRREAAALTFEHIQLREGRWVIADLIGKGNKLRSPAIPAWTKAAIDAWAAAAGVASGRVFRSVNRGGRVAGAGMTAQAVRNVVNEYSTALGYAVAPHDLRRTHAKLARKNGAPLEEIKETLGHASVQTTEIYLGRERNWHDASCDRLGIRPRRTEH